MPTERLSMHGDVSKDEDDSDRQTANSKGRTWDLFMWMPSMEELSKVAGFDMPRPRVHEQEDGVPVCVCVLLVCLSVYLLRPECIDRSYENGQIVESEWVDDLRIVGSRGDTECQVYEH